MTYYKFVYPAAVKYTPYPRERWNQSLSAWKAHLKTLEEEVKLLRSAIRTLQSEIQKRSGSDRQWYRWQVSSLTHLLKIRSGEINTLQQQRAKIKRYDAMRRVV